jgi:ornithine cyclodeaminase/alanine dehydrogenase-like protein (mu-crystallin family)
MLRALNPQATIVGYDINPESIATLGEGTVEAASPLEAVEGADIVVSAAPIVKDAEPALGEGVLGERWLGLPVDFDAYFSRALVASADLMLTDDVGQFEAYRGHGYFKEWPSPERSVGDGLAEGAKGERVLCCNLGVGALDAAFGKTVLDRAQADGVGIELER